MIDILYKAVLISKDWVSVVFMLIITSYIVISALGFKVKIDKKRIGYIFVAFVILVALSKLMPLIGLV